MNKMVHDLDDDISHCNSEERKKQLYARLLKVYSVGIEANCHNNEGEAALSLLHEMAGKVNNSVPIPRSCYLVLFSYFSSISGVLSPQEVKDKLKAFQLEWKPEGGALYSHRSIVVSIL